MKKILLIISLLPTLTFAAHNRCGIGSLVFGKSKGILSQTSEMLFNSVTSGQASITSGTSGCKHSGKFVISEKELLFIATNMEEMIQEISQGGGETMDAYAQIIGCNTAQINKLNATLKSSMHNLVPKNNMNMDEFIYNLRNEIQLDQSIKTCHANKLT